MNPQNPRFNRLINVLTEVYKQNLAQNFEVVLVPLEDPEMYFPGLAVCIRMKGEDVKPGVGYHLIVIQSDEDIPSLPQRVGDKTFEIPRPPSQVYDAQYESLARDILKKVFPDVDLHSAVGRVLPRAFNFADEKTVYEFAADCAMAATAALQDAINPGEFDIKLETMERGAPLAMVIDNQPARTQGHDRSGLPVRSDTIVSAMMQNNDRTPVRAVRMARMSDVRGFFDVIPLPDHKFQARFVITQLDEHSLGAGTISQQLLALALLTVLSEGERWRDSFIAALASTDETLKAGITWLFGEDVDLSNVKDVKKRMDTLFRPGLVFSMDVGNASAPTWRHDVFMASALNHQHAVSKIMDAAQTLTSGRFSRYFPPGMPVTITENAIVPIGYYFDKDGKKRSLQDVDQLYVAAIAPTLVTNWCNNNMRLDIPTELRFANQCEIVKTIVGAPVLLDQATRFSFAAGFLKALVEGCRDAGLQVRAPAMEPGEPDYTLPTVMGAPMEAPKKEQAEYRSGLFGGYPGQGHYSRPRNHRWE